MALKLWLSAGAFVALTTHLVPVSDVILRKYEKRDGTLQWTTAHEIFSQCQQKPGSLGVTQNHGDSRTSISMFVPFVDFHGISFSY